MNIANNIVFLRKKKGLTQAQLGEILGVTGSQITNYEKSKSFPTVDVVLRLAELFGVSLDSLFYGELKDKLDLSDDDNNTNEKDKLNLHLAKRNEQPSMMDRLNFLEKKILEIEKRIGN
jgi:transcriptional regulator with XRE-family HTH domain